MKLRISFALGTAFALACVASTTRATTTNTVAPAVQQGPIPICPPSNPNCMQIGSGN